MDFIQLEIRLFAAIGTAGGVFPLTSRCIACKSLQTLYIVGLTSLKSGVKGWLRNGRFFRARVIYFVR